MGCEKMVTSQVMSLGWLPSVGSWLHTGEDSRGSHSKVKEGLFREETHSIRRALAISEGKRGTRVWALSVFIGVSNFMGLVGGVFQLLWEKGGISRNSATATL